MFLGLRGWWTSIRFEAKATLAFALSVFVLAVLIDAVAALVARARRKGPS